LPFSRRELRKDFQGFLKRGKDRGFRKNFARFYAGFAMPGCIFPFEFQRFTKALAKSAPFPILFLIYPYETGLDPGSIFISFYD